MSSVQCLRDFVHERLTAAAEEIFRVFEQTVLEYEEEIDRQRRLLDIAWKPEIKLHRTEFPRKHVWKKRKTLTAQQLSARDRNSGLDQEDPAAAGERPGVSGSIIHFNEEVDRQRRLLDIVWSPETELQRTELPEQHVCKEEELLTDQERNPSLDQEDPEPPQIKEEQEEVCTSQEGEQLVLKQIQTFMLRSPYEGSDHSEPEPTSEEQLLSHISPGAESQVKRGGEHVDPGPTGDEESQRNNSPPTQSPCSPHTGKTSFMCDICGKVFVTKSKLNTHVRIHTGERPFSCDTCGKAFLCKSRLTLHLRVHTGERPYSCDFCGQTFSRKVHLQEHISRHTGERPFFCKLCGKNYKQRSALRVHMRVHTGERPFSCDICQKTFLVKTNLLVHMRLHTGEKPCICSTCGRSFIYPTSLRKHIRIHTEEKLLIPEDVGEISRVVVN
ncbi:zinc finger protein OZF-like [Platichthys flesus]|uniref:zinc finger protein OZF-like n=1 Tax=Platichthys flesus TaxID=8260 RepID=UPI002DC06194|nr:zinc finger protein OZF-like [Platichthys flesus]